ncbi:hypothetical protein FKM82_026792 [Ascaphus truei]
MMMGSPHMAELLISYNANPKICDSITGTSPAHDAAREGFLDTLIVLLRGGADLYAPRDCWGNRAIDLAPSHVVANLHALGIIPPEVN